MGMDWSADLHGVKARVGCMWYILYEVISVVKSRTRKCFTL